MVLWTAPSHTQDSRAKAGAERTARSDSHRFRDTKLGGLAEVVTTDQTIFVVDDDPLVRRFIVSLLTFANLARVEDYESGQRFLAEAALRDGDCVVLDLNMPDLDGLAVQRELKRRGKRASIIVLTGNADVHIAVTAMRAGAFDFIVKPVSNEVLVTSVTRAISEATHLSASQQNSEAITRRLETLTRREREVFDLVVRGAPNKLISHELNISERTVEAHRSRVMKKMDAPNLVALVRMTIPTAVTSG